MQVQDPRLYILMRTDMPSLNPGKAMAQAAHAGNMLSEQMIIGDHTSPLDDQYKEWLGDRQFGTTIVLEAPGGQKDLDELLHAVNPYHTITLMSGVVHDPTYPVTDGAVTHLVPIDTCVWVFGMSDDQHIRAALDRFRLHP